MKIRPKKSKNKKSKKGQDLSREEIVDTLGDEFTESNKTRLKAAKIEADAKDRIKELASSYGKPDEEGRVVCKGSKFAVGFSCPDKTPVLDVNLAQQHFPASVVKKCLKEVFDPEIATRLYSQGKIDTKTFQKCLVEPPVTKKIYVKEL